MANLIVFSRFIISNCFLVLFHKMWPIRSLQAITRVVVLLSPKTLLTLAQVQRVQVRSMFGPVQLKTPFEIYSLQSYCIPLKINFLFFQTLFVSSRLLLCERHSSRLRSPWLMLGASSWRTQPPKSLWNLGQRVFFNVILVRLLKNSSSCVTSLV